MMFEGSQSHRHSPHCHCSPVLQNRSTCTTSKVACCQGALCSCPLTSNSCTVSWIAFSITFTSKKGTFGILWILNIGQEWGFKKLQRRESYFSSKKSYQFRSLKILRHPNLLTEYTILMHMLTLMLGLPHGSHFARRCGQQFPFPSHKWP